MPFLIRHEKFEGPLDLLLELVQNQKLAISDISLARVADDYLRYVRSLDTIDREELYEFLAIAGELLLLKSRALVARAAPSETEEAAPEELAARLAAYRDIRELAAAMGSTLALGRRMFTREQYAGTNPTFSPPLGLRRADLAAAYQTATADLPIQERLEERRLRRIISLEEKIRELLALFNGGMQEFSAVTAGSGTKAELIVSFLALLELARRSVIELEQRAAFADILIKQRNA